MNQLLTALRPRWRKMSADLWDNKMRTILVVASIAVGVFAVGAITTAYVIMSQDINLSYASVNPANIEIITDPFDDNFVDSITKLPTVATAEGQFVRNMRVSEDGQFWQTVNLRARNNFDAQTINQTALIDGIATPERRQILFEFAQLNDPGFRVNDTAYIQLDDGVVRTFDVVGVIGDQTNTGDFQAIPRAYISLDSLNWLGYPEQYNRLYVIVSTDPHDEAAIKEATAVIEDKIEKSGRTVYNTTITETDEHPMASTILAVLGILGALGILIMLLSSSLIVNTLNALLTQHLRQIGIMKLVGAQSFQISGIYILLILTYGLIALIISVPTGAIAGYGLSRYISNLMNANLQGFRLIPIAITLQIIIAFIVPLAAGFFPVNQGSKIKVRRAISNDGPVGAMSTTTFLDNLGRWLSWLSRPLILSIRNTFRRRGRLALTLFTLTMAGAIFIAVFNVRAALNVFIDQISQHFMADITLTFDQPYRQSEVERIVRQNPQITDIEGWLAAGAEILDANDNVEENLQIFAPPSDSQLIEAEILTGRWLQPNDSKKLVVADSIWNLYPNLQPGDSLRVTIQDKRAEAWTVIGIFRFTDSLGGILAYADYDTISEILNLPEQAFSYRLAATAQTLDTQKRLSSQLDQDFRKQGFNVDSVEAGLIIQEDNAENINILVIFLLTMSLLTAFVGSIGLAGTMGMNVLERTREIGVMRAIGAVDLEIIKSVVVEGVMIGFISWLLAIIVSFPISLVLLNIVGNAIVNDTLPFALAPEGFVIWFFVVFTLSVVASMLPARNAARLTIREVLAYE